MKKSIGLVVVLVLVGIMLYSFIEEETASQYAIAQLGEEEQIGQGPAPHFTLETLDGDTLTLADFKGKKVVLNFWATWCPPCRVEMPHMQSYYDKYSEEHNVEIIAVNATFRDKVEQVQRFVDGHELTFPIALAKKDQLYKDYEIMVMPTTIFIDTKGYMQHLIRGPVDEKMLYNYVQKLN